MNRITWGLVIFSAGILLLVGALTLLECSTFQITFLLTAPGASACTSSATAVVVLSYQIARGAKYCWIVPL